MASRGFLIRFIDIGLIVLFGFLMISDIESSSRVELSGAAQEIPDVSEEDTTRVFLIVEIRADGGFLVTDPQLADSIATTAAGDSDDLADQLAERSAVYTSAELEAIVLIQPHPSSLVQFTVDALDVCDRLGLPKSLRMDIEVERDP